MKIGYIIAIIGIVLVAILFGNYVQKTSLSKVDYNIISEINYDNILCGSTGYTYKPNGFNTGLRLVLKDKNTAENIEGYARISHEGGGGDLSLGSAYSCEEQIGSQYSVISVYAKGYTPIVFEFDLLKNQLATVEVSMMKSCTGGLSCFDNLEIGLLERANGDQTKAQEIRESTKNRFFDMIKEKFRLDKSDYELQCMECDMGRGGYIKAKGTYKDGSPLELYYHWGWCSSGGSDCGWDICLTSESDSLFASIKNSVCNKISSKQYYDGSICIAEAYDDTEEAKNNCLAGEFEKIVGDEKTLAIKQISNRCKSSVEQSTFDCLEN